MKIPAARLGVWSWVLIYLGMIVLSVGVALQRNGQAFGAAVMGVGIVAAAAGIVLIWIRSRAGDAPDR